MTIPEKQQQMLEEAILSLPVMPLKGGILFPFTLMPLYIYEDRFCKLVKDVLQSSHRMMSLAHCNENEDLENIIGVGQIIQASPQKDGRYHILLQGWTRIQVEEELVEKNSEYRCIKGRLYNQEVNKELEFQHEKIVRIKHRLIQNSLQLCRRHEHLGMVLLPLLHSDLKTEQFVDLLCATVLEKEEARQECLAEASLIERMGIANQAVSEHLLDSMELSPNQNEVC